MSAAARLGDLDSLLADLNEDQRAAAQCVRGPVVILAGAGSGKTRVISRRAAYAAATGAVDPNRMLIVTFTEKAGAEMSQRINQLGLRGVIANNVHSVALRQLNYLWPRVHESPAPSLLPSPYRIVDGFLRRTSPQLNSRDVVAEIGWAKRQAITPNRYLEALNGRTPGVDPELVARAFDDYERRKRAAGQVDFDDLLIELARLINENEDVARLVRSRRNWICVDEFQDTNHIQDALFSAWLGESTDFCVVGDPDQAIFGFTGATAEYLTGFERRFTAARRFTLAVNYRSSPQVLEAANRLLAAERRAKQLVATRPAGPQVRLVEHPDGDSEVAGVVSHVQLLHRNGVAYAGMAILFRQHAHKVPFEQALSTAHIPYISDDPFFARREVVLAIEALSTPAAGTNLTEIAAATWRTLFGFDPADPDNARDARYDAVNGLLALAAELQRRQPGANVAGLLADLRRRADDEAAAETGVELTTYHQAKGREWPAVFLPMLEDGTLPDFRARTSEARSEEWRLLYVGVTRAERHLRLSYATRRTRGEHEFPFLASPFIEPLRPLPPQAERPRSGRRRPQSSGGLWTAPVRQVAPPEPAWPSAHTEPIPVNAVLPPDTKVVHQTLGAGRVINIHDELITVTFDGDRKDLRWPEVATSGKLRRDVKRLSDL